MAMRSHASRRSPESALGNPVLVQFTLACFLATIAECSFFVGVLVYAYDQGGSGVAGVAAVVLLLPTAIAAPAAGAAAQRRNANHVRLWALAVQSAALAAASVAAFLVAPVAVVVACCALAAVAFTFLGPVCGVLLPAIVRSARELTVANVWMGACENTSVLGGAALATVLLSLQGPALVLAGGAALSVASTASGLLYGRIDAIPAGHPDDTDSVGSTRLLLRSIGELRQRPGTGGVLAVAGGGYVLVGALDLVVVVLAIDALGMGDAGPGLLATSVGAGGLINALTSAALVRRDRLAPLMIAAIASIAAASIALGIAPTVATATILLAVAGFSGSMLNLTSRMLLQRATPPHVLGTVFGAIELFAGIGMVAGSLITQLLIAVGGVRTALIGVGAFFVILLALTWRSLGVADDSADIPIVAISLLSRLPAFAPLAPLALEAVARAATEVSVVAGQVVMTEGEVGDRFYAVADGSFDIVKGGQHISTAERGGCFGEVALLANVPRTATITASRPGALLAIHRVPFLVAVTGSDSSRQAAWGVVRAMGVDVTATEAPTIEE
jgi:MFS family permease